MTITSGKLEHAPSCPVCNKVLDGFTIDANDLCKLPKAGDCSICVYCRTFLVFTHELQFREITPEEIVDLPAELRTKMVRFRDLCRKRASSLKGKP